MSEPSATSLPESVARPKPSVPVKTFAQRVGEEVLARWGARVGLTWIGIVALLAIFAPFIANSHPYVMRDSEGNLSSPLLQWLSPVDVLLLLGFFFTIIAVAVLRRQRLSHRLVAAVWLSAAVAPALFHAVFLQDWHLGIYGTGRGVLLTVLIIIALPWLRIMIIPLTARFWSLPFKAGLIALGVAITIVFVIYPVLPPRIHNQLSYRERIAMGEISDVRFAPIPFGPTDAMGDLPDTRSLAPGWYPRDPNAPDLSDSERRRIALTLEREEPLPKEYRQAEGESYYSRVYILGTTPSGYDLASRMIHACRIALAIGFIATGIAVFIGIVVGALLGYFSGWVDLIGLRIVEIIAAIPTIFLLIAIVAFYGRNLYLMMVIIGLTGWVGYALFVRAEFLRLRKQDFVQAAIACGLPLRSVLFRHMLPNGVAPVLVQASFGVASAILTEATLSFLGLGLVDEPSWGQLLNQAREGGKFFWWIALYPTLAIFLTVYAYNLVGEAMRDAIDPHMKKAAQL